MARYVDGFVIPIKKKKVAAYRKMAKVGLDTWMKHGALEYYECVADDTSNNWGLGFPKMCKLKKDETVFFSFIVFKSKAHRNQVNKKVMTDPVMDQFQNFEMPNDMKRFAMAGFKSVISNRR